MWTENWECVQHSSQVRLRTLLRVSTGKNRKISSDPEVGEYDKNSEST